MSTFKTPKGTELPFLTLKGKLYLQVAHRLVWFREERPGWSIKTTLSPDFEKQRCISKAEILDDTGRLIATAHKVEDRAGFADFIEKSETGAIGRALALCGYGTQFAPELDEEDRIVDSPTQPGRTPHTGGRQGAGGAQPPAAGRPAENPLGALTRLVVERSLRDETKAYMKARYGHEDSLRLNAQQIVEVMNAINRGEIAKAPAPQPQDAQMPPDNFWPEGVSG